MKKDFIVYRKKEGEAIWASDIFSESRRSDFVYFRIIIAHHLREKNWPYSKIAYALNRVNHTSAMNAVRNYDYLSKHHPMFMEMRETMNERQICKVLDYGKNINL